MPGYRRIHRFEGLGEFRETVDKLATASAHPVVADLGRSYGTDDEELVDPHPLDHQAIWNTRDDELSYIGTDVYTITQHHEILDVVDRAVGETVGEIDIGRIRDFGDRIDGMLTLHGHNVDVEELVGEGYIPPEGELLDDRTQDTESAFQSDGTVRDILGVGVRFGNSFDASERISFETMGYRYICQNWMVWGEETIGEFTQLHVDELNATAIEELIFDVVDKQEQVGDLVREAVEDELKWSWVDPFLEDAGFGKNYRKRIIETVRAYGGVSGDKLRRWDLYNGITDHLDHHVMVGGDDGVNPNVYDRHQSKAQYVLKNEAKSPSEEVPLEEIIDVES